MNKVAEIIQNEIELIESDWLKNALNPNEWIYYKGYLDALDTIQRTLYMEEKENE